MPSAINPMEASTIVPGSGTGLVAPPGGGPPSWWRLTPCPGLEFTMPGRGARPPLSSGVAAGDVAANVDALGRWPDRTWASALVAVSIRAANSNTVRLIGASSSRGGSRAQGSLPRESQAPYRVPNRGEHVAADTVASVGWPAPGIPLGEMSQSPTSTAGNGPRQDPPARRSGTAVQAQAHGAQPRQADIESAGQPSRDAQGWRRRRRRTARSHARRASRLPRTPFDTRWL